MRVETFTLNVKAPTGPVLAALEAALLHDGRLPLRWAVVAVEGGEWVIEGARLAACSQSST